MTTVCADRKPVFAARDNAQLARSILDDSAAWSDTDPLAWVLMPDHWHGLLLLGCKDSLGCVVQRIKAKLTQALIRSGQGIGKPVWQPGFHDHALRREEDLNEVIRYILLNPVRAGLVSIWSDWPFRGGSHVANLETSAV